MALNDRNFIEAPCFKIVTCDPEDDTVDNMSSLPVGIAIKYAKHGYSEGQWAQFYEALCLAFECEDVLRGRLKESEEAHIAEEVRKIGKVQIEIGKENNNNNN